MSALCPDGFDPVAGLDPHSPVALRRAWVKHAASCPVCGAVAQDHALGSALLGPPPPAPARAAWPKVALAAAAGLVVGLLPMLAVEGPAVTHQARSDQARGITGQTRGAGAAVTLAGEVHRGEAEVAPAEARLGDVVQFSVTARPTARVWVWVRTPDGLRSVGSVEASDLPTRLGDGAVARGWQLDLPGPHVFFASAVGDGECGPEGCPSWRVDAR
jgi:hypothetical protein